jgi:TRAP-type C4-dicarboxylate transport system permease large subunit
MQLSFLVMGMFLDDTAMLVIVAPLYVPLVAKLDLGHPPAGADLVWRALHHHLPDRLYDAALRL